MDKDDTVERSMPAKMPQIRVGLALSDAGLYQREVMTLPDDLLQFFTLSQEKFAREELFFELQPELPWLLKKNGYLCVPNEGNSWYKLGLAARDNDSHGPYRAIIEMMRRAGNLFGVHQSIRGMDILSQDISRQLETIESTQLGMQFAHLIAADYFVFHLAQSKDYWDWSRSEQIAIALKAFRKWADFYKQSKFDFTPVLENLEFPKFPATALEIVGLYNTCREILPNLKLCLDLPHLWHSRLLLLENKDRFRHLIADFNVLETPFDDYLEYTFEDAFAAEGIEAKDLLLYHFGGCWKHSTHEIPGLRPGESPFYHALRLNEPKCSYNPALEMNLPKVLNRILGYNLENAHDLLMVLEIYQRNYNEMLEAARIVEEDLRRKAVNMARRARRYAYLWE
jgi:sugar phosphate isomerase/epimerase